MTALVRSVLPSRKQPNPWFELFAIMFAMGSIGMFVGAML